MKFSIVNYLAKNVKQLREERNWSRQQLADLVDLSVEQIEYIEQARTWLRPENVEKISNVFEVDPSVLFLRPKSVLLGFSDYRAEIDSSLLVDLVRDKIRHLEGKISELEQK